MFFVPACWSQRQNPAQATSAKTGVVGSPAAVAMLNWVASDAVKSMRNLYMKECSARSIWKLSNPAIQQVDPSLVQPTFEMANIVNEKSPSTSNKPQTTGAMPSSIPRVNSARTLTRMRHKTKGQFNIFMFIARSEKVGDRAQYSLRQSLRAV